MASSSKKKRPIPARTIARIASTALQSGATDKEELHIMFGHRAEYLGRGLPTNANRRNSSKSIVTLSSRPLFAASGARAFVF